MENERKNFLKELNLIKKQNNQILLAISSIQEELKRKKRKPKKKISVVGEDYDYR